MNRKPSGLFLSKAVEGFGQFKRAEGLSSRTVDDYLRDLEKWVEFQGDQDVPKVTKEHLRDYLSYLLTEYEPQRITGNNEVKLSPKTVHNVYIILCSFFHWVRDEFKIPNPMKGVPVSKYKEPPIEPFTKDEIESLLKACDYCKEAKTDQRHKFTMRRATGYRDRAIILTLLDSGLRASELCSLKVGDLDPKTGKLTVKHGATGGAKGGKGRTVFLGKVVRKAVWRYLTDREDGQDPNAPLFIGKFGRPFNRDALRQIIKSLGDKAGVKKRTPPVPAYNGAPVRASGYCVIGRYPLTGTGILTLAVQSTKKLWAGQLPGERSELCEGDRPSKGKRSEVNGTG